MEGIIVQESKIFNPKTVPEYLEELEKWHKSLFVNPHSIGEDYSASRSFRLDMTEPLRINPHILPEGPFPLNPQAADDKLLSNDEFKLVSSGASMGLALYPKILDYLVPLQISGIANLGDWHSYRKFPKIEGISGFKKNLKNMASGWPVFDAVIKPDVPVGRRIVKIEMHYGSFDNLDFDEHRSVSILAAFRNHESSRTGLRNLGRLYPEMLLNETLFAVKMPQYLKEMHKQAFDYLDSYWSYGHGFTGKKPESEYDSDYFNGLCLNANVKHFEFLSSIFKELGIFPHYASYYDFLAGLNYKIEIGSMEDAVEMMLDKSFKEITPPEILASFNEVPVTIESLSGNGFFGINIMEYAIVVKLEKQPENYVLEDLLERIHNNA